MNPNPNNTTLNPGVSFGVMLAAGVGAVVIGGLALAVIVDGLRYRKAGKGPGPDGKLGTPDDVDQPAKAYSNLVERFDQRNS